ncbi:MAG: 2-phosphosulfolactate phosphatase [Flavobacteriales bacterium]|jgi:2-phosphosulfolactate phosphatase|nr:2-phosphosulfolactate phosphatase [Flavobacteriales bacterium]MBT6014140.1 2-phosphosulfolactate phosphatase [Flavobacteriales bacterium]MBT7481505.1 2-phosphosulfolactate phosphatase [Flavobacteriales bacterium]
MRDKRNINVCFSPELFPLFSDGKKIVVVVDVLRATSVISTAFQYGIKDVIAIQSLEEATKYKGEENCIVAAERNAEALEGFDYGNSPFQYMNDEIKGKTLVLTTTNGTRAINMAREHIVITSSFVNFNAVCNFIKNREEDVLIFCSGWKGNFNMEDSLFAGKLSDKLLNSDNFQSNCDSALASISLYKSAKDDLFSYLENSAHRNRLKHLNMEPDTRFCLSPTFESDIVPILKNGKLIRHEK